MSDARWKYCCTTRRCAGIALAIVGLHQLAFGAQPAAAQEVATAPGQYHVVHGWPQLPPGEVLGAVAGVGVDTNGRVFVFRRAGRAALANGDFDPTPIPRPTVLILDGLTRIIHEGRNKSASACV